MNLARACRAAVFAAITPSEAECSDAASPRVKTEVSKNGIRRLAAASPVLHEDDSSSARATRHSGAEGVTRGTNSDPNTAEQGSFGRLIRFPRGRPRPNSSPSSFALASQRQSLTNILFVTGGGTELASVHEGMKWLADQKEVYKVAFMFVASDWVFNEDGSGWQAASGEPEGVESSASLNGWLVPEENQVDENAHPHDRADHPRGCPDFGDPERFQSPEDVLAKRDAKAKGAQKNAIGVAADTLKELKRSGVHLVPYRLGVQCGSTTCRTSACEHGPRPYADYIKNEIFEGNGIDLVVADILALSGQYSIFETGPPRSTLPPLDLKNRFFPILNAKKTVSVSGSMAQLNERPGLLRYLADMSDDTSAALLVAHHLPGFQIRNAPATWRGDTRRFPLKPAAFYSLHDKDSSPLGPAAIVMQHPPKSKSVGCPPPTTTWFSWFSWSSSEEPHYPSDAVTRICNELRKESPQELDALIYVAFGTQGFGFTREAVRYLVRELLAASPTALIFLVRPKMVEPIDARENATDSDDAFFRSLPHDVEQSLRGHDHGRLLVHDSEFAPQREIFITFSPDAATDNPTSKPRLSFLTHGGVGSLAEAVGFGIPMLCLPFKWDQPWNCRSLAEVGHAIYLGELSAMMTLAGLIRDVADRDDWCLSKQIYEGKELHEHRPERDQRRLQEIRGRHRPAKNAIPVIDASGLQQITDFFRRPPASDILSKKAHVDAATMLQQLKGALRNVAAQLLGRGTQSRSDGRKIGGTAVWEKMRQNLELERHNIEQNTLSRDADVGPVLAAIAKGGMNPRVEELEDTEKAEGTGNKRKDGTRSECSLVLAIVPSVLGLVGIGVLMFFLLRNKQGRDVRGGGVSRREKAPFAPSKSPGYGEGAGEEDDDEGLLVGATVSAARVYWFVPAVLTGMRLK